jgi:hypothetical protein
MSLIITDRMKTVMKRWLSIKYPKAVDTLIELQSNKDENKFHNLRSDDNLEHTWMFDLHLEIELDCNWDNDDDSIEWDNLDLSFSITFNKYAFVFERGRKMVDLFKIIDNLTEFKQCTSCNHYKAKKDGFCDDCYPWITTQEEDCCICLDNSPKVWIKLPCNHIMHKFCYSKVEGQKCPLCRVHHERCYHGERI